MDCNELAVLCQSGRAQSLQPRSDSAFQFCMPETEGQHRVLEWPGRKGEGVNFVS